MSKDQHGRIVLITGGSSGIGLATAGAFLDEGDSVVLVGRDTARLDAAREQLAGRVRSGACMDVFTADVSRTDQIDGVVEHVVARHGHIDVVFANAGTLDAPPVLETDEAAFDRIMNTNVKGVFFLVIRALPHMPPGGAVVVTSSAAADKGRPAGALYAASKASVRSLVRTLALDIAVLERRIRINAVTPGLIETPMTSHKDPAVNTAIKEYVTSTVPMGRWGLADEVARSVVFLSGDSASYVTGTQIVVDGGLTQI
ncbi:SDR family NAD(P)-dependent oxidoreductase [Streptomyces sp. NPDC101150]|uniref:SDR family NAD(P)-dependent oxidoreductase n=1 Tax=Streptomyces sp. NPDC101150 TaxID=3366114 RepID=UPI0037F2B673